jgi:hypothetical protein
MPLHSVFSKILIGFLVHLLYIVVLSWNYCMPSGWLIQFRLHSSIFYCTDCTFSYFVICSLSWSSTAANA